MSDKRGVSSLERPVAPLVAEAIAERLHVLGQPVRVRLIDRLDEDGERTRKPRRARACARRVAEPCGYYGACGDAVAAYADEVMARAVQYGFQGTGAPEPTNPEQAQPQLASADGGCGSAGTPAGELGEARRATSPQGVRPLPTDITPGTPESCDARVVPDVVYLARRYGILVTDCYGLGHAPDGEHPLGVAIDAVPKDGNWSRTLRLARALGWSESCAASGVAPSCADPPFRFIGYNGFPSHGDPESCVPCTGGPHIHISWLTSASPGQPDNAARYGYTAPEWIDVLASPTGEPSEEGGEGRRRA